MSRKAKAKSEVCISQRTADKVFMELRRLQIENADFRALICWYEGQRKADAETIERLVEEKADLLNKMARG